MSHPIDAAMADPWGTLGLVLGEPLHPGGAEATEQLLDRADVGSGTRLLDVGCGAGQALSLARERGARAVGLDRRPRGRGAIRGDLAHLPIGAASVDVVLAECVLCLSSAPARALAEARRVLGPGGRLAVSDVVVEGDLPELPAPMAAALCLDGPRGREETVARVADAAFAVEDVRDHREDLLDMRDRAADRVDYRGLLGALGERGRRLLDGVEALETAIETGDVGYVSVVAVAEG